MFLLQFKATTKHKRVVLLIASIKVEVIKLLEKSVSYTVKSEKHGIERSTDADIKKEPTEDPWFQE